MHIKRKYLINIFLTAFCILMVGCNITYKVRNQYSEIEYIEHFSCGKVSVELIGKGNSTFTFKQWFDVDEDVSVSLDSLRIRCNNKPVFIEHNMNSKYSSWVDLRNRKNWEASFKLEKGVFEGDTIVVYGQNYLRCNDDVFTLDSLVYSFRNNLRIKGVND